MSRYQRPSYTSIGYPSWTPGVKRLILACVIAFVIQLIVGRPIVELFGLTPADVLYSGQIWQLATYIFLHSTGNILHLLFNMLGLWMFGSELELLWGTRKFTKFFFICGIGAGILMVLLFLLSGGDSRVTTIGASGSVYGVLLAFGVLFPDRIIYWIIFPIPAKYFVMIMGGIAFFSSLSASNSGIAHVAHLGGMFCGFLYLKYTGAVRGRGTRRIFGSLRHQYDVWRRNRLRRKFDVYYNQRHNDNDKWRWKN
jgi:membrane associated rhomboid family serine protease